MRNQTNQTESTARHLCVALVAAITVSTVLVVTALNDDSTLGAPHLWPWLLTGVQVLALSAAGRGSWWGWLLGGSVQIPWIAYAVMTVQLGFIPGCAISASVQLYSYLRGTQRQPMEAMT